MLSNRIISFIESHNILHNFQFGFRVKKSTSHALAHVLSSLIDKCNNDKMIAFAVLDLKKAFDVINHDLLLSKISHYGIRGLSMKWLSSYLFNRTQKTKVSGCYSDIKSGTAGESQGSILGSLLFLIFVNDFFQLCNYERWNLSLLMILPLLYMQIMQWNSENLLMIFLAYVVLVALLTALLLTHLNLILCNLIQLVLMAGIYPTWILLNILV